MITSDTLGICTLAAFPKCQMYPKYNKTTQVEVKSYYGTIRDFFDHTCFHGIKKKSHKITLQLTIDFRISKN